MLKAKIAEGTLKIDDHKMIIIRDRINFFDLIIYSLIAKLFRLQDDIRLNDITIVAVEKGIPEGISPHIHVHYGKNKSRIIEFHTEKKGQRQCEIDRVIDFLEKKKIPLGIMRSD
jgi:hypothetical protein